MRKMSAAALRGFWGTGLACVLTLLGGAAAQAQCPTGPIVIDLKAGAVLPAATAQVQVAFGPAACPALKAARVSINLNNTSCKQANIVVEYEGKPTGWTVNLGDSPTNDGYAGDGGTTQNEAELWITDQVLALASGNIPPVIDSPLLRQDLALTDSAIKFVVKDQFVSWGQPYGYLQTPATKKLYALPDNDAQTQAAEKGSKIYLGLNQVITGRSDRLGCGARRALITLQ